MKDPGLPLASFRQHKANIGLHCNRCALYKVVPLEATIERLNARGLDGENVGIVELSRHVRQACERCGAKSWTTRPAFPSIPGQDGITRAK